MRIMQQNGRRANSPRRCSPPLPLHGPSRISLQQNTQFFSSSLAKEAHIPRRLHPNTKQRRNDTGPPKPSFRASHHWYRTAFEDSRGSCLARAKTPSPTCSWVYRYVCSRFPKTPVLACEDAQRLSGVARKLACESSFEEVWALRWVTIGLRRINCKVR